MKTTIEIPDSLFRRTKSCAALNGVTLKEFFTEALEEKLAQPKSKSKKISAREFAKTLPKEAVAEVDAFINSPEFDAIVNAPEPHAETLK